MRGVLVAAGAAALLIGACSRSPSRPIVDGYTLHGVVTAPGGAPLRDVSVLIGREGSSEFRPFTMTGDDGAFLFKPAPNTGPSTELFRFEKTGFATREVPARNATPLEPYRYRLTVELDPVP
ncbi:MAG TPA: carboxypeptidase-like regulatory domain-containing protein [Candidatus Eisenbacteria bacterium]|nr:carboxypeptidase-like regulatory domain-containing protein [Candidatus Eisenbacteria bacterium]